MKVGMFTVDCPMGGANLQITNTYTVPAPFLPPPSFNEH